MDKVICKNCGEKIDITNKFCPNCGVNLIGNITNKAPKKKTVHYILLIMSIINIIIGVSFALRFLVIWFIFGGLSGDVIVYTNLLIYLVSYIFTSVIALIVFIINAICKGKFIKPAIIITILTFIISFFGLIFVRDKYYNSHNDYSSNYMIGEYYERS